MNFKSVSVNNCYILDKEVFENQFFTYINAKAIYSASIFHLAFLKGDISSIPYKQIEEYQKFTTYLYQLNSPYLYIPFEVNFHENRLYQVYYESDHFPLSLWIEEKSLIPFNVFIVIMEDILNALKTLEISGHSHLLLTPEEILIPLNWDSNKHARLYNPGINLIAPAVLSEKEINAYRGNYTRNTSKILENGLIKNISNDLYSFGKIMYLLSTLCKFDNEKNKDIIQNKLDIIIRNPETFKSIDDSISLFDDFFNEKNRINILPEKSANYTYSGRAGLIVPEFDEWQPEAELQPLIENNEINSDHETSSLNSSPFLKSISNFLRKLFTRKKHIKPVSKTLEDYLESDNKNISDNNNYMDVDHKDDFKMDSPSIENFQTPEPAGNSRNTDKILEEIEKHYYKDTKTEQNYSSSKRTATIAKTSNKTIKSEQIFNSDSNRNTINIDDFKYDQQSFVSNFNSSLEKRDYTRTYNIIMDIINRPSMPEQKLIIRELNKLLNEKMKKLNEHFINDTPANLLTKLAKINELEPMGITGGSKNISADLDSRLKKKPETVKSLNNKPVKRLNLLLRIFQFIKKQYRRLIK